MELLHQNLDSGETRELSGLVTACKWKTVRRGAPGQMDLTLLRDGSFTLAHGDILALKDGDRKIFYGYLFKLGGSEKARLGCFFTVLPLLAVVFTVMKKKIPAVIFVNG